MFGTLRIHHKDHEVQFIDRTGSVLGHGIAQRIACDFCRLKKVRLRTQADDVWPIVLTRLQLRCSGQRTGCNRCEASGCRCIYSPSAHSRNARRIGERGDPPRPRQNEKGRRVERTKKARTPPSSSTSRCPKQNRCESKTSQIDYEQDKARPEYQNKPEPPPTTLSMDIVKTSPDHPSLEFSPTAPDLLGDLGTQHGPSIVVSNTYSNQQISIDGLWNLVPTADTYPLAFPIDLPYAGPYYESTSLDYFHSASSSSWPDGAPAQFKNTSFHSAHPQESGAFWV